jgi:hypothetical protein
MSSPRRSSSGYPAKAVLRKSVADGHGVVRRSASHPADGPPGPNRSGSSSNRVGWT